MMNIDQIRRAMAAFPKTLATLLTRLREQDLRWKPNAESWSLLEIICHLADEEELDFRVRLQCVFRDPKEDWPPIDTVGWVTERKYNEQNAPEVMERFRRERDVSLIWLRDNKDADWNATHTHPKFGSMSAGELLSAWHSHDLLHLRQLTQRLYEIAQGHCAPYSSAYAGEWS